MTHVLIVVDAFSAEAAQRAAALKNAISIAYGSALKTTDIEVVSAADLSADDRMAGDRILCPLTLDLPETLLFPARALYATCHDVFGLRKQLEAWHYVTGAGAFWLPIALTAKGALYSEVIGIKNAAPAFTASAPFYTQPVHLSDRQRQPLYALGQRLLRSLNAPPAVYLIQFGWQDGAVCFDRLFPFPAAPAIASLNVQTPDLFACHWSCLTGKPLLDLTIG